MTTPVSDSVPSAHGPREPADSPPVPVPGSSVPPVSVPVPVPPVGPPPPLPTVRPGASSGPVTTLPRTPPAVGASSPGAREGLAGSPDQQVAPRRRRRWLWPVATAAAFAVGLAAGGSGGDPTSSPEFAALASENADLQAQLEDAEAAASTAQEELQDAESELAAEAAELDERSADLDTRQADVEARETAVTATEDAIAASQIEIGTWTVGVDVQPGTYRTAEAVTSTCYWGIYRSGSNKDDIVDNDIVTGGFPTVTLAEGQDFENGCGVFVKQ
ncbi:MAG TPA: hypothetical protein VN257_03275 [Actinotalea sp.]|nr:hypothetical protein [Actinotalea sp.]